MANMFQMMKQAHQMRKIQKEMQKKEVELTNNDKNITVIVRGDMTIKSLKIEPSAVDMNRLDRLEKTLVSTINSCLDSAKKAAAGDMQKLTKEMGLDGLFGG